MASIRTRMSCAQVRTISNKLTSHGKFPLQFNHIPCSYLHISNVMQTKKAGRHRTTPKHDNPLTYEQAQKPDMIGVRKSWNSFNTTGLRDGIREAEIAREDILIRKFVHGTWPDILASDLIIKRRANMIILNFIAIRKISPVKMHFLIGYTEEILSYIVKAIVRIEPQTADDPKELVYKCI